MKNKFKPLFFFFLISIPLNSLHGFIAVDFEELPDNKTRIIALDTRTQQLLLYKEVTTQNLKESLNGYSLSVPSGGGFLIEKQNPQATFHEPMIVRSTKPVTCSGWEQTNLDLYTLYSSHKIEEKTPNEIINILLPSRQIQGATPKTNMTSPPRTKKQTTVKFDSVSIEKKITKSENGESQLLSNKTSKSNEDTSDSFDLSTEEKTGQNLRETEGGKEVPQIVSTPNAKSMPIKEVTTREEKMDQARETSEDEKKELLSLNSPSSKAKSNKSAFPICIEEKPNQNLDASKKIAQEPQISKSPSKSMEKKIPQTLAELENKSKGTLGELATVLTMLSFGYTEHPSKYGQDNGLDGIFQSVSKKYLFLTQTKQEKKARTAENIMENFLNEQKIWDTLKEMKRLGSIEVNQTATLVEGYFQGTPDCVYKLAYRMTETGASESQINLLKVQEFPRKGPKLFNASPKDKVRSVQSVLTGFEENPDNQLLLALRAISLPSMSDSQIITLFKATYDLQRKNVEENTKICKATQTYTRDNLYNFLVYLNSEQKYSADNIFGKINLTSADTIQRLINNRNHAANKHYEEVWKALIETYSKEHEDWTADFLSM